MIAPNQIGPHPPGHRSGGRSLIVDPWGLVLAGAPDTETVIVADLDFERQRDVRRRLPSLANRRPEAYRWSG
ncbi:MAG: nitrilase-related carbon-nitrogen hydrolase, partial [Solirubrobacteraceae bacterium]